EFDAGALELRLPVLVLAERDDVFRYGRIEPGLVEVDALPLRLELLLRCVGPPLGLLLRKLLLSLHDRLPLRVEVAGERTVVELDHAPAFLRVRAVRRDPP